MKCDERADRPSLFSLLSVSICVHLWQIFSSLRLLDLFENDAVAIDEKAAAELRWGYSGLKYQDHVGDSASENGIVSVFGVGRGAGGVRPHPLDVSGEHVSHVHLLAFAARGEDSADGGDGDRL